jgi:catalase
MEGFGVHTFRLTAPDGSTRLVKWHWKPAAGVHSLVWEESQKLGGIDPDYHRRDLHARIATGNFPVWQLGVQVMPDTPDQTFEGIDLLDATKLVPEELCPVRLVGTMTLDRNPANYFAETEQVAFHPGHLVPGIGLVDDPLLQARLFSYLDTQLTRLGGPNFAQIPVNRPLADVNDNNRDGFMQQAVHEGATAYSPNSLGGGCPFARPGEGVYTHSPHAVNGPKLKLRPASFDDHFTQATLFYRSLTDVERDHIVAAFSFELAKCVSEGVGARVVGLLANVDADLATRVAQHLGIDAPRGRPFEPAQLSPALSLVSDEPGVSAGRVVALLAGDDTTRRAVSAWRTAADPDGVEVVVVGPHLGQLEQDVAVDRSVHITDPVEYDGVILATAPDPTLGVFVQEAYRHHKTVALLDPAWSEPLGIDPGASGVAGSAEEFFAALALHRHWER